MWCRWRCLGLPRRRQHRHLVRRLAGAPTRRIAWPCAARWVRSGARAGASAGRALSRSRGCQRVPRASSTGTCEHPNCRLCCRQPAEIAKASVGSSKTARRGRVRNFHKNAIKKQALSAQSVAQSCTTCTKRRLSIVHTARCEFGLRCAPAQHSSSPFTATRHRSESRWPAVDLRAPFVPIARAHVLTASLVFDVTPFSCGRRPRPCLWQPLSRP